MLRETVYLQRILIGMMIIMAVYMIGRLTLGADCPIFFLKNNISKGFEYVGFMDEAISISCFIFFQKNLHVSSRSYPIILLDYGKQNQAFYGEKHTTVK